MRLFSCPRFSCFRFQPLCLYRLKPSHDLQKLTAAVLGAAILSPTSSLAQCLEQLKGKTYTDLPQSICPNYTDALLGANAQQQEYGGVVCDHPKVSYILVQKLLNYTAQGKAVWQVVQIKKVSKPQSQSFIMLSGCQLKQSGATSEVPIVALVLPGASETFQPLAAWQIDLSKAAFRSLKPQQVVCKDPLL